MSFDATALGRAARQLDEAVRIADSAIEADVPRLFGRGEALDLVRGHLGDAADFADGAAADLKASGAPFEDAIASVEELGRRTRALRDADDVARERVGSTFRQTVDSARSWQRQVELASEGARAARDGLQRAWLEHVLADDATDDAIRTVRMLADADSFGGLDTTTSQLLSRLDPARPSTVDYARVALRARGAGAQAILEHAVTVANDGGSIDPTVLRFAAEGRPARPDALVRSLPASLADATEPVAIDVLDRARLDLLARGTTTAEAMTEFTGILSRPSSELSTLDRTRSVVLARALDDPAADALAAAHGDADDVFDVALLDAWSRGVAPSDVGATVDQLLTPGGDPVDAARRLARLADTALDGIGSKGWRQKTTAALAGEQHPDAARALVDAVRIARAGGPTPAELAAALEPLGANRFLDVDELRAAATLSQLPKHQRPELLADAGEDLVDAVRRGHSGSIDDLRLTAELDRLRASGDSAVVSAIEDATAYPDPNSRDRARLARLLEFAPEVGIHPPAGLAQDDIAGIGRWIRVEQMIRDHAVTLESLTDEVRAIAAKADDDITQADFERLALIDSLGDDAKRPTFRNTTSYGFAQLADGNWLPGNDSDGRAAINAIRTQIREHDRTIAAAEFAANPATTLESLTDEIRAIAAKTDDDITQADFERLALIDSLGDDAKRPTFRNTTSYGFAQLADGNWLPGNDSDGRAAINAIRTQIREHDRTIAAAEFAANPATTLESLTDEIRAIAAKADDDITQADFERLALIDSLGDDAKRPTFRNTTSYGFAQLADGNWLPGNDSDGRAAINAIRTQIREHDRTIAAAEFAANPATTLESLTDEIRAIAAKADDDITQADFERLALIDSLGDDAKRPTFRNTTSYSFAQLADGNWLPGNDSDGRAAINAIRTQIREHDRAAEAARFAADPATTLESLTDEIRAIAAKTDDDITQADFERLALIDSLGDDAKRPTFRNTTSYGFAQLADGNWLPGNDSDGRAAINAIRTQIREHDRAAEAARFAADPATTLESLTDEIRAIAAKTDDDITQADFERLALIDSLGDDAKRPTFRNTTSYSFAQLADGNWLPGNDSDGRAAINAIRTQIREHDGAIAAAKYAADPAVTAETISDELAAIGAKRDDEVTVDDLHRLAFIDRLGDHAKRPSYRNTTAYTWESLANGSFLPSSDSDTRAAMNQLRVWLVTSTPKGRSTLIERLARDESLPAATIQSLLDYPDELAAAGIDHAQLQAHQLRSTLRSLSEKAAAGSNDMLDDLKFARSLAESMPAADPGHAQVHSTLIESLDRNIDRIEGRMSDGFANYVDFADVGNAVSAGELLTRLNAPPAAATHATTGAALVHDVAAATTDTVVW